MSVKLARRVDAIPVVDDNTDRTAKFPTPQKNQRVHNLATSSIERYTGSAWVAAFGLMAENYFHVEDPAYGAVGGDTGDQTSAINAAATAAITAGGILTGTPGITYRVASTVDFTDLAYCDFTGTTFNYTGAATALKIGGVSDEVKYGRLVLPKLTGPLAGGPPPTAGASSIAIHIQGLFSTSIVVQRLYRFGKGLYITGGGGTADVWNNDILILDSEDCLIGLHIFPTPSTSFVNQNIFRGGRIGIGSTYVGVSGNRHILIDMVSGGLVPNGNQFFNINIEGAPEQTLEIVEGNRNFFNMCRWEAAAGILFGANTADNLIFLGVTQSAFRAAITDNGTRNGYMTMNDGRVWFQTPTTLADEATPTVQGVEVAKTGGTTAITDFDDGKLGQKIELLAAHTVTITHNASIIALDGGGNFGMLAGDTLTLTMFNDQVWQETSRTTIA